MRKAEEITLEDAETGFAGYLVIDPSDRELSFGGTRIDPAVTRDLVVELSENMSLKLAVHGSPVGGAKAGVRASPDDPRLKGFLHRFAEACREALTSTTILGKDMGAKQWMLDEIYRALGMPQLGLAQRRHPDGRCPDRPFELDGYIDNMTGQGVFWSIEEILDSELRGARVNIQGFGVVGAGVAVHLEEAGARLTCVSDRSQAVLGAEGLDVQALLAARDDGGLLVKERLPASCTIVQRDELLAQPADVLVLAAGSYVVNAAQAERIQAPVVVEGANLALTPEARAVLHAKKVRVVPDVVANSASAALVGHQIASGNTLAPKGLWAEIEAAIKNGTEVAERAAREWNMDSKSAFRKALGGQAHP